ncbi:MAG: sugar isomerase domain-containing protein [Acidobacteriaceae bacterium]
MTSLLYFKALKEILTRIESEQISVIRDAGGIIASAIASGGILHTFGSGHSHMISEEAFYRAGGLAPVNPILDPRLLFLEGAMESTQAERESGYAHTLLSHQDILPNDVAIIISNSGRNAVPIEMALEMRSRGIKKIIAITNLAQSKRSGSRHVSGKRLFELADLIIDNCVPEGDAAVDIPGSSQKVGPTSTIAGAAIINAIIVEAAANLQQRGLPVPIFPSANNEVSSHQSLEALLAQWASRVPLFRDCSECIKKAE